MGRTRPSNPLPPQAWRKDARAKKAKTTLNKTIPALLKSDSRARKGVESAELIVDPQYTRLGSPHERSPSSPKVSFLVTDTICAALQACDAAGRDGRVGVLNMASPLRPGGGFLQGATSQEEFLCGRTTLYPSLQENFYRLPELGAVWSPDVLIFRDGSQEGNDLGKTERRYVGVVSAGMLRFPELQDGEETYASTKDTELVEKKMRAVMRIFQSKGMATVILGAWGCGAYGNPVRAVASCCKKVLLGGKHGSDESETWDPVKEVIFAINDRRMAEEFARHFGGEVTAAGDEGKSSDGEQSDESVHELEDRIAALEIQLPQARSELLKSRLEEILAGLKQQLNRTDEA